MSFASGKASKGLCSSYLQRLIPHKSTCRVFVRPSTFKLPKLLSTPIIMIGTNHASLLDLQNALQCDALRFYKLICVHMCENTNWSETNFFRRPWHWDSTDESPSTREKLSWKRQQRREKYFVLWLQEQKHWLFVSEWDRGISREESRRLTTSCLQPWAARKGDLITKFSQLMQTLGLRETY